MNTITKKVCILGSSGITRPGLVRRFAHTLFGDKYISTIGVKVSRKTVTISDKGNPARLTMILWELTNLPAFNQLRVSYLRGTAGAVLVCDLTRPETLDKLYAYANEVISISPNVKLMVAANRLDTIGDQRAQFALVHLEAISAELDVPYQLISLETGTGVEVLFTRLGQMLGE